MWHGRLRLASFPRYVQVGTNWTCDLSCDFCRRQWDDRDRLRALAPDQRELPESVLEALLRILPYAESFSLTPLGEPLLYSGLDRILDCHRALSEPNLMLTTNGNALSDARARRLVECRVRRLYVSVDSADPAQYAALRRGGRLERVSQGLQATRHWRERSGGPWPEVVILATLQRSNVEGLADLVRYGRAMGARAVAVQIMDLYDPASQSASLACDAPALVRCVRQGRAEAARDGAVDLWLTTGARNLIRASADGAALLAEIDGPVAAGPPPAFPTPLSRCAFPWSSLMVDTNGEARPCCWASYAYGNLARDGFDAVWNGPAARALRQSFLDGVLPAGCRSAHCRVTFDSDRE